MREAILTVFLCGCAATVDPRPDYERASETIRASTGATEVFEPEGPTLSPDAIRAVLDEGLTLEEATRLALLENRRLQAGFLELGVARADYVQSGLVRNPSLSLALLVPDGGGRARWTADLVASLSDLWEMPLRREEAGAQVDRRVLELAGFAVDLVASTREAYFRTVAARELASLADESAELARRAHDAAARRAREGVATRIDESLAESLALAAELGATRARREEVESARELAALLSLELDLLDVELADRLPPAPERAFATEDLVERGLRDRLDLRALERDIGAAERRLALERRRRIPEIGVGASAERPEGGGSSGILLGPAASVELPIFDRNEAQASRAAFRLAQLRKEREALAAEIAQRVRAAADREDVARAAAGFARERLVPAAERAADLAARAYDAGEILVLALLESRRASTEARRTQVEADLEAARARIELERTLGAPLDAAGARSP